METGTKQAMEQLDQFRLDPDPVLNSKSYSKTILEYFNRSLMLFDEQGRNFFEKTGRVNSQQDVKERLRKTTFNLLGQAHLTLSKEIAQSLNLTKGDKNITYISEEMAMFLDIDKTRAAKIDTLETVLTPFGKQFIPSELREQLTQQQTQFYSLINEKKDFSITRLPNVRLYIQDQTSKQYYSRIIYTYSIFLRNYEFLGVLHISQTLAEIKKEDYEEKRKSGNLFFPDVERIKSLQEKRTSAEYNSEVDKINKEIEEELYQDIGDEGKVYKFIRDFQEKAEEQNHSLDDLQRKAEELYKTHLASIPGTKKVCACIVEGTLNQKVKWVSPNLLEFWGLEKEEAENKTTLEYYLDTYGKKINQYPDDNDHLYKNIAEQLRYSLAGDTRESSTLVVRMSDEKYCSIYRKIAYTPTNRQYTLFIVFIDDFSIKGNALKDFEQRKGSTIPKDKDVFSDTFLSYAHVPLLYQAIFTLRHNLTKSDIEQLLRLPSLNVIDTVNKAIAVPNESEGKIFFQYDSKFADVLGGNNFACNEPLTALLLNNSANKVDGLTKELTQKKSLSELFEGHFRSKSESVLHSFNTQCLTYNYKECEPLGVTHRLPDIYVNYDDETTHYIEIIYAFAVYVDSQFLGILGGHHKETYAKGEKSKEKEYKKRLKGLELFRDSVVKSCRKSEDKKEIEREERKQMSESLEQIRELLKTLSSEEKKTLAGEVVIELATNNQKQLAKEVIESVPEQNPALSFSSKVAESNASTQSWVNRLYPKAGEKSLLEDPEFKKTSFQTFIDVIQGVNKSEHNYVLAGALKLANDLVDSIKAQIINVNKLSGDSYISLRVDKGRYTYLQYDGKILKIDKPVNTIFSTI